MIPCFLLLVNTLFLISLQLSTVKETLNRFFHKLRYNNTLFFGCQLLFLFFLFFRCEIFYYSRSVSNIFGFPLFSYNFTAFLYKQKSTETKRFDFSGSFFWLVAPKKISVVFHEIQCPVCPTIIFVKWVQIALRYFSSS